MGVDEGIEVDTCTIEDWVIKARQWNGGVNWLTLKKKKWGWIILGREEKYSIKAGLCQDPFWEEWGAVEIAYSTVIRNKAI